MPTITPQITAALDALARRVYDRHKTARLSPAVEVMGDLGRLVNRGRPADIKTGQAAVAALRERLDHGGDRAPEAVLDGDHSSIFLAGALWAVNELMTARLDALELAESLPGRKTRKSLIETLLVDYLAQQGVGSPTAVLGTEMAKELDAQKYEISRAVGDLIARGHLETVEAAPDSDRRLRYFALTATGTDLAAQQHQVSVSTVKDGGARQAAKRISGIGRKTGQQKSPD